MMRTSAGIEPEFLPRLAQRGGARVLALVDAAAGEGDLAGMGAHIARGAG